MAQLPRYGNIGNGVVLGVSIVLELLGFLRLCVNERVISEPDLGDALTRLGMVLGFDGTVSTVQNAQSMCEAVLDSLESVVNGTPTVRAVRGTVAGRLVGSFIDKIKGVPQLSQCQYRVFIDEYETLLEYQQRAVNTLIKHSDTTLVYNIGMRPKGMKTPLTLSDTEIVQAPHDYTLYRIEFILDPEDDKDQKQVYLHLLQEICTRRFKRLADSRQQSGIEDNIEFYLGRYDIDLETERITNSRTTPPFLDRLRLLIRQYARDDDDAVSHMRLLADEPPPLYARLHLCLLSRTGRYRPSLEALLREYRTYLEGKSGKYTEWLNNTKLGLVFLLSHEYKREKLYYGFDVFTMLSSGVVRYFLELCERSFDFALTNGFSWDSPRRIAPEEQTAAARFVSRYKVRDITGYAPYGRELRMFIQGLGLAFESLHHNPNATLGEPEPNHFCADDYSIDAPTRKILNSAVMWAVLQDREPTKQKTPLPKEMLDYHLNHIYCPYFGISYRTKRKIEVSQEQLQGLLSGEESRVIAARDEILHGEKHQEEQDDGNKPIPIRMPMDLEKR